MDFVIQMENDFAIQMEDDEDTLQSVIVHSADDLDSVSHHHHVKPVKKHHHGSESTMKASRKKKAKKPKRPMTTFRRIMELIVPQVCIGFLFSETNKFNLSKFFLGLGFGGLMGFAIYLFVVDPLKLPDAVKIALLCVLAVVFAFGWALSKSFRCTNLVMIPNILGKEGRAYLFIFVLAAIYAGPGANLQHNFSEIPRSIGCTAELQINNTKLLWKILSTPVKNILKNVVQKTDDFKNIGEDVKSSFKTTKDEVESKSGYDNQKEQELYKKKSASTTQEKFEIKNLLRCEYIIGLGVDKCYEWFEQKHGECMRTIAVPLINHILCIPMKFSFLCGILNIGEGWCKKYVPVDKGFGGIFDQVNSAVNSVESGMSSTLTIEKEDDIDAGLNITEMGMKDKIMSALERRKSIMTAASTVLKHIMGITFIFLFLSAYNYTRKYNSDIRFDNNYVTTYFRQVDARRRKQNKRYLLPMKKGETSKFIFPFSPKIHAPEMSTIMIELRQCVTPVVMLLLVIIFDKMLYHILDIIRRHANISYVFASHHKLEVMVGGNTLLANILRRTIGILNSTSNTFETSNNEMCLPHPIQMTSSDYFATCLPVIGLICLSIFQVYFFRLRRAIASYFFPKREKCRVLFLYNEQLRKRAAYADYKRKQIMHKAQVNRNKLKTTIGAFYRHCKWMRKFIIRRCIVCNQSERKDSYVCPTPDCATVYCRQCWKDMKKFCFACTPYEEFIVAPDYSDSEHGSD